MNLTVFKDDVSTTLYDNTSDAIKWQHLTDYDFLLRITPGEFFIEIRQGDSIIESFTVHDDTFTSGKVGLYSASQPRSQFKNFKVESLHSTEIDFAYDVEAIDPDNDRLEYTLLEAPQGMIVEADSGLIQWNPEPERLFEQQTVYFAGDWNATDWEVETFIDANDGNAVFTDLPSGGHPDAYRNIQLINSKRKYLNDSSLAESCVTIRAVAHDICFLKGGRDGQVAGYA